MEWKIVPIILAVFSFSLHFQHVSAEKILVVAFTGSRSHKNAFEPLYVELAKRGHQLTIIHPVKSDYADKNIKEIAGVTLDSIIAKSDSPPINMFEMRLNYMQARTPLHPVIVPFLQQACESYYEMPEVKAILKQKFAVIFVASHMNECTYGLVHKLNTSYIFVHPHAMEHYKTIFTGFRLPASFVPSYSIGASTDDMNILERTLNFIAYQVTTALYEWYYIPRMESVYRAALGQDVPSIREIERNASLVLNNAHFSLTYPRPQMPQVIDVAGMHCRPGQPLPQDLQDFVESSGSNGFIYFSMGSHVESSKMPKYMLQYFVQVFSKIKQKVIWKFDLDKIEGLSSNVKLVKWAPQQDILAHPKIRAFMTHGGLLSIQEAIYHGTPLIGLPLFGDQDWNMKQAESHGFGITLQFKGLNAEQILEAINKVLSDKSYSSAAKALGKVFKDRQDTAVSTAVFYSEYVMRHKGAVHLRSAATKLNCISYYCLDVIALLTLVAFLIVYIPIKLCKLCFFRSSSEKDTPSKKKHNTRASSKKNN